MRASSSSSTTRMSGLCRFPPAGDGGKRDRKSTRLNSSHLVISYAVFCLKKKKNSQTIHRRPHQIQYVSKYCEPTSDGSVVISLCRRLLLIRPWSSVVYTRRLAHLYLENV